MAHKPKIKGRENSLVSIIADEVCLIFLFWITFLK